MNVISIQKQPEYKEQAIDYFQNVWAKDATEMVYKDCIKHTGEGLFNLPQWYLLMNDQQIIGCAGLITNDFISRMDLFPWLCALYIHPDFRGNNLAVYLIEQAKKDTKEASLKKLYLSTDHIGYYEKFDFTFLDFGYHPWNGKSRIYVCNV